MKCARPSCQRKARPGKNRGLCGQHYESAPFRGYVDSGPARERVRLLRSRGMTLQMLTSYGVSRFGVRCIESHPRIQGLTERKVFAIPVPEAIPSGAPVDATGTRRRVQALVAMGWPQEMIAAELGTTQTGVSALTRRSKVSSQTAIAVRELFERWGMVLGPSEVSRRRARTFGWVTGVAWDDIDDPDEKPNLGELVPVRVADRIAELQDLGVTDVRQIARRLGVEPDSVKRALLRGAA